MKFIELTLCTQARTKINKIIVNVNSIQRIDDQITTRIWIEGFDEFINILESYAYLRYELTNCERVKQ